MAKISWNVNGEIESINNESNQSSKAINNENDNGQYQNQYQ